MTATIPRPPRNWLHELIVVGAVLIGCVVLLFNPTGYKSDMGMQERALRALARVVAVDNSSIHLSGIYAQGEQEVTLEILSGPFAGERVEVTNLLQGNLDWDRVYEVGDSVRVLLHLDDAGKPGSVTLAGLNRLRTQALLALLFGVLLLAILGWTGVKTILSFAFAALVIWRILVPCFLLGYDPIPVSLAAVAVLLAAIMFLVGGLNKRGLVAFLGGMLGLGLTCALALLFAGPFHVDGTVRPNAPGILMRMPGIDITRIFLAGIFIASSGAVMDLAMDVSAAMYEIVAKKPGIGALELMRAGLSVGRAVIGTMTTTLLFAYSGGYMMTMMWFMTQGVSVDIMLNTKIFSAEIMNTLVGSFGLVTVAPFTALVGGFLYTRSASPGAGDGAN